MQAREKLLLAFAVVAILLWQGLPFYKSIFVEPLEARDEQLLRLDDEIAQRERTERSIRRANANLRIWKEQSLPADWRNGQILYLEWLTDLAKMSEFAELKVTPTASLKVGKVYTPVRVRVEAQASYEQLCKFLSRFHKGELLHRVAEMDIKPGPKEKPGTLAVAITAEGLALRDSEKGDRLFPKTELSEDVSQSATTINVAGVERFPKKQEFLARAGHEILKVKTVDATKWTVERATESTNAAAHSKGGAVELFHVIQKETKPAVDVAAVASGNLFVKPALNKGPTDPLDSDYAKNTWLRSLVGAGDEWRGWIYDASNKRKIVGKGSTLQIESLEATVTDVQHDHMMVQAGTQTWRLGLGLNLHSMKTGGDPGVPTSTQSASPQGSGDGSVGRAAEGEDKGGGEKFDRSDPKWREKMRERFRRGGFGGRGGKGRRERGSRRGGSDKGSSEKSTNDSGSSQPAESSGGTESQSQPAAESAAPAATAPTATDREK